MPSAPTPKGEIEQVIIRIANDMHDARVAMHEVTDDNIDDVEEMAIRHYLARFVEGMFDVFFMVTPSSTTHPIYHNLMRVASHMVLSTDGRTLFLLNSQSEAITQSLYALFVELVEQHQDMLSMARLFDCACDNNH
jgi:hypothetical protein